MLHSAALISSHESLTLLRWGCIGTWSRLGKTFWKFRVFIDAGCINLVLGETICPCESCPCKVGTLQIGIDQLGSLQMRSAQPGFCSCAPLMLAPCSCTSLRLVSCSCASMSVASCSLTIGRSDPFIRFLCTLSCVLYKVAVAFLLFPDEKCLFCLLTRER